MDHYNSKYKPTGSIHTKTGFLVNISTHSYFTFGHMLLGDDTITLQTAENERNAPDVQGLSKEEDIEEKGKYVIPYY